MIKIKSDRQYYQEKEETTKEEKGSRKKLDENQDKIRKSGEGSNGRKVKKRKRGELGERDIYIKKTREKMEKKIRGKENWRRIKEQKKVETIELDTT